MIKTIIIFKLFLIFNKLTVVFDLCKSTRVFEEIGSGKRQLGRGVGVWERR